MKTGCLPKVPHCEHPPAKQVYKLKVHIPGTRDRYCFRALNTRDIKEVDKKLIEFIDELKKNNYAPLRTVTPDIAEGEKYLLAYHMKRFLDYITNGGFYEFEAPRERSVGVINDYKRYFKYFLESIASAVDVKTVKVDEIKPEHLELFHKYIRKKTSSDKYYNNIMSALRCLYNHLNSYERLKIENPFNLVPVLNVEYDPQSFTWQEFNKVLSVTNFDNGYDGEEKRNRFRKWLPTAFKLGVFTDLRLEELVYLKYSDIVNVEGISIIETPKRKVNKLIGNKKHRRIKRIPVIPELRKVLDAECSFADHQGSGKYIIAPDLSRTTVKDVITKGFTHFKRVAGISENKCFKELRKTFTSRLQAEFGDSALTATVSDHSSKEVVKKHYLAQMDAVRKASNFCVFPDAEDGVN